jgi:hypothetical protein
MENADLVVISVRLGLSVVFGAVIGLEREARRPARRPSYPHSGRARCGIVHLVGTEVAGNRSDTDRRPGRLRRGFSRGGCDPARRPNDSGLTTAATLWAAAAIGLANGLGAYRSASAAYSDLVVTVGLKLIEKEYLPRRRGNSSPSTSSTTRYRGGAGRLCPLAARQGRLGHHSLNGHHRIELQAHPAPHGELPELAAKLLAVGGW